MSRVFAIQETRHQADISPAQVYGDVEFVLAPTDRMSSSPELYMKKLRDGLAGFLEKEDYILWSGGDPLSCLLTGTVLRDMGVSRFRYLRYEKPDPRKVGSAPYYVPVSVDLDQIL